MAIAAYLVRWTCVRPVCAFIFFLLPFCILSSRGHRVHRANHIVILSSRTARCLADDDSRWCTPTGRLFRTTTNVVVAIHRASSPWNGRSVKWQVWSFTPARKVARRLIGRVARVFRWMHLSGSWYANYPCGRLVDTALSTLRNTFRSLTGHGSDANIVFTYLCI